MTVTGIGNTEYSNDIDKETVVNVDQSCHG